VRARFRGLENPLKLQQRNRGWKCAQHLAYFEFAKTEKEQGVRAIEILHDRFREQMPFLHRKRWLALWNVVQALLLGQRLWLTALGRALPTAAGRKHAIKAVDRLIGNKRLHGQRFEVAKVLAQFVLPKASSPIVLVDTMEIRFRMVAVTASLAHEGRSFPIWSTTIKALRLNAAQCRRFLNQLRKVLPTDCRPILVTDAGFESAWLQEVERLGWHYVTRVRGQAKLLHRGVWVGCQQLHRLATNRARNLGQLSFPKNTPFRRRVVLSKLPQSQHRRVRTRRGPGRDNNYKHYRKNAHEPLVLTTSLSCRPSQVVAIYKTRMQIEESFRDLKCHRWGWSLRHCLSRSQARIEILLLVASIAIVVQQLIGIAGERRGLERLHQANTVRSRRVLSIFLLGGLLISCRDGALITSSMLREASSFLRRKIAYMRASGP
jgi:hypothetical protein